MGVKINWLVDICGWIHISLLVLRCSTASTASLANRSHSDFRLAPETDEKNPRILLSLVWQSISRFRWLEPLESSSAPTLGSGATFHSRASTEYYQAIRARYPSGIRYEPPEDIGASFYPMRGPYSSSDRAVVMEHFRELKDYVIIVSWWGMIIAIITDMLLFRK